MNSCRIENRETRGFVFYVALNADPAIKLWATTLAFLREEGVLADKYVMTVPCQPKANQGHPSLAPEEVHDVLHRVGSKTFRLRYNLGQLSQGIGFTAHPLTRGFGYFNVGTQNPQMAPRSWQPLIERLAREVPLALASIHDRDYIGWQHCADANRYRQEYGPAVGFKIKHPLPPPREGFEELDLSSNPGRFDCVAGGPAFVSADMWLGPAFWTYAPCRKEEILNQPWLRVRQTDHFLYLNAYPEPFTKPDGEQGEIQRRLWRLLFHSDCRWPPGEGATA